MAGQTANADELGGAVAAQGTLAAGLARGEGLLAHAPVLAVEQARAILEVAPANGDGHALLGRALAACGRGSDALDALRQAARLRHENPQAWRLLGDLLAMAGDEAGADSAYVEQIRTSVRDPRLRQAALALADNDLPQAEPLLRAHLRERPTDVAAIRMLAELAARIGRYADAATLLRRALTLAPSFTGARHNLATVLYRNNQLQPALAELDLLLAADPDNPAFHNLAAAAAMRLGAIERALVHFERALARAPDQAKIWMSYGHALKTMGRSSDGIDAYRRALALDPLLGEAWWSLANLKTVRFDKADMVAMAAAQTAPGQDVDGRFHIAFALGKALEDAGRHAESFAAYGEGNRLRRELLDYAASETSAQVDRQCAVLTRDLFAQAGNGGCKAADPIFVLGMPRAGSTLIEQILASHPATEGTQELPDIHAMALRLGYGDAEYGARLRDLGPDEARSLGEEYLDRTRVQRRTDRPRFIDKMPNNWQHVGLIRLILPKATIVDARRHPLACCFSNFKQHFARGQAFSYDLVELGHYYRDYVRLMAHFDAVLPGYVHRVFYEDMVADTEAQVRRLLDHVGVPFDPACLDFHRNARAVRTASSQQVRQPIFREGLDQWRHFEPWLAPLREALGDVLDRYPEVPLFPAPGV